MGERNPASSGYGSIWKVLLCVVKCNLLKYTPDKKPNHDFWFNLMKGFLVIYL